MTTGPRPYRRQLLISSVAVSASSGWAMVVTLVSLPLLLRGLGVTEFGIFALIQAFSSTNGWFSLADLGAADSTTYLVSTRAGEGDAAAAATAAASGLALFFALALGCGCLLSLAGPEVIPPLMHVAGRERHAMALGLAIYGLQIAVDLVAQGAQAGLEGLQRVDLSRLVDGVRRTLIAVATVTVALTGGGLVHVVIAGAAAATVSMAGALLLVLRLLPGRPRVSPRDARTIARYGGQVAIVDFNGVAKRTMDKLLVGAVVGPAAVALVEIVTQVANGVTAFLGASTYVVTSSAGWLRGREAHASAKELFERATKYSLLITMPVALGLAVLAGPVVRLWVGGRYHDAIGLIPIALIPFVSAPLQVGSNMLRGTGHVRAILAPAAVSTAVNLVASVALVELFGIVGTFEGTIVGTAILVPYLGRRILAEQGITARSFIRSAVAPVMPALVALGMILAVVAYLDLPDAAAIAVSVIGGGAAYLALAWLCALDRGEVRELIGYARKRGPLSPDTSPAVRP